MYIGVSKISRAARGGSSKQDKKFIEAVNKAVQQSSMVSQKVITRVSKDLGAAITTGNERAVILLKKQLDSLKVTQALNKTQDAELAKLFQQGQKLNAIQYQQLDKYLQKMVGLSTDLNMVLQTNLSNLSDDIVKAVNGDASKTAKLQSAKQLAQAIGSSGMFDQSPAFKELLAFTKTQTDLTEQSTKQLVELVDKMNMEVQSIDRLNDLIKIAQDSSKDEKTQINALNNIIVSIEDSNKYLTELNQLKAIANSSEDMSRKMAKLGPLLTRLETSSLQTRTLHTLQQIEFGIKKGGLSDVTKAKIKSGAAYVGGAAASKAATHGSDITKFLMSKIPILNTVDMATDGWVSDKVSDIAGIGAGYAGAKVVGKVKGVVKNGGTATRAVESGAMSAAERMALKAGGSKGVAKLLGSVKGKYAVPAGLLAAGYYMFSGDDAEAAPMVPQGVAVPQTLIDPATGLPASQTPSPSSANSWAELGIYATAPKIAEKTGVAALASKATTKAATSLLGESAGGALAKGGKALLGKAGGIANLAVGAYDYATANNTAGRKEAIGSTVGGMAGMAATASIGAAIGSIVPIAGTAAGAVIGGLIGLAGGAIGSYLGSSAASLFENPQDNIPDDVKKKGSIAEAIYVDEMIKSGQYDADDIKELQKYQKNCLSNQNVSDYINNAAGGNVQRLMQIMGGSALSGTYPDVYSAIMGYANNVLIPRQKHQDAPNIQGIDKSLNTINKKQDVGKSVSSLGDENKPSNSVESLQIKTQKSITAIDALPAQDQKQISDVIDAGLDGSSKADAYVDDSSQHSLVNKLMGWVSNVLPTGIFPIVTLGVTANSVAGDNVPDWLSTFFRGGGGGFFGGTKGQPSGTLPRDYLSYPTSPSQPNPTIVAGMTSDLNRINIAKGTKYERVRSFRNNNFGNIEFRGQAGATMGDAGRFARWETPEEGLRAVSNQLVRYYTGKTTGRQLTSVKDIINTWAPSAENNTPGYINSVAKSMGVDPNQPLDLLNNSTQMREMVKAISKVEGGVDLTSLGVSDKFIDTSLGAYNQKTGKYEGEFNQSTLLKLNKNRESAGLEPISKKEQCGNIKTPFSSTVATSTGSGITPVSTMTPTASGIITTPMNLDANSSILVKENEQLKNTRQNTPPIIAPPPAPNAPSTSGGTIRPPSHIDDYGLAFANKLMWDN